MIRDPAARATASVVVAFALALGLGCVGCGRRDPPAPADAAPSGVVTLSVVGTNDLHGRIARLPILGGYLSILRRVRAADGGGVVLVDAGDMFQGTLESNLGEGAAVIAAYRALGYAAAAVGNHEFDFGPVGPAATPASDADDARGALKARAAEAPFPLLCANLVDATTKARVDWPNMPASIVVDVAGVPVGIVGLSTEETPTTTIAANFRGLAMAPLAPTLAAEARALRDRGAVVVVAAVHAGSRCVGFSGDVVADRCEVDAEIARMAHALPPGAVDVVVAGHSHAGVAHRFGGVAVVEAYSYGRAFSRVDLRVDRATRRVVDANIHVPHDLCEDETGPCDNSGYEGALVVAEPAVAAAIAPAMAQAAAKKAERLGTVLATPIRRHYDEESALGNLFADLVRAARPSAAVGLMNGGGLRASLPSGELTYGALYEAFPFDNKVASARLSGADLRRLFAHHLASGKGGILSVSGVRVVASCARASAALDVRLVRDGGREIRDDETVEVVANDFLLTGGDGFWGPVSAPAVEITPELVRDAMLERLRGKARLAQDELLVPGKPRLVLPGPRPVRCGR